MTELFTREYADELVNRINSDPEFQKKASSLNLKVLMVNKDKGRAFLLTFENGKASGSEATPETPADFAFIGDHAVWVSNHKGEAPLERLIMSGKIKFKGNMARILGVRSQLTMVDQISQKIPATY